MAKTGAFDQPGTLMDKTIELLKKKNLVEVSAETEISFYWLRKFVIGTYRNPSVNRVQFLYEYLSGNRLV